MQTLDTQIEAILFHLAEPIPKSRLATLLDASIDEIIIALDLLRQRLESGGTRLVQSDRDVTIATAPEQAQIIEKLTKETLTKELSRGALETLAIILYKGPVSRSEVDYIRGVNSNFLLRNLLVRGLIEKQDNPNDQRSHLYATTQSALLHLGITSLEELPEREKLLQEINNFVEGEQRQHRDEASEKTSHPETHQDAVDHSPWEDDSASAFDSDFTTEDDEIPDSEEDTPNPPDHP